MPLSSTQRRILDPDARHDAGGHELEGIGDQVRQGLSQHDFVSQDLRKRPFNLDVCAPR